jgi:hypothetical protein
MEHEPGVITPILGYFHACVRAMAGTWSLKRGCKTEGSRAIINVLCPIRSFKGRLASPGYVFLITDESLDQVI